MDKGIVAVVVTYNRKQLLIQNVEALLGQSDTRKLDILIIDNASTDGTYNALESFINNRQIIYYNTGSNLGGAGGFNYGIKKAVELGYEYVWVMDDDTIPQKNTLQAFLTVDSKLKGRYGYLSSKVLWKDGNICTMNIQKKNKWKRLNKFASMQKIQYASFVSLFIKSSIIQQVGLPYKDFFIWADDWEYTRRISKQFPCYFVPESVVEHRCNANVGANIVSTSSERIDRFKYMFRNDVVLYRQDGIEGKLYLSIRNATYIVKILFSKSQDKLKKINILRSSTQEGKNFYPMIEYVTYNHNNED